MAEYTELIKALRHCYEDDDACATCQRWLAHDEWGIKCKGRLISDAAAAIEALQAQLPKRGEWIHGKELSRAYIGNCCVGIVYEDFRCSACGVVVKECEKPKWKYCPNCGAKMEVQE